MLYPLSHKRMHESSEPCHSFPHAANAFRWLAHVSCRIATTCLLKEHASFFYPFFMAARALRWYVNGTWHYLWDGPSLPGTLRLGSIQDVMPAYNKLGGMSSCNHYRHHTHHYAVVIAIVPSYHRHQGIIFAIILLSHTIACLTLDSRTAVQSGDTLWAAPHHSVPPQWRSKYCSTSLCHWF